MKIKKLIASFFLLSFVTNADASLQNFKFPENFETEHSQTFQLLKTIEISPKAIELFNDVQKQHEFLKVELSDNCRTGAHYTVGTNVITIGSQSVDNPADFCESFLWETCNSTNKFLKLTELFHHSNDEHAFFKEAAEHNSCVRTLSIFSNYFEEIGKVPDLKKLIEQVSGCPVSLILDKISNDNRKTFKSYWNSVNTAEKSYISLDEILHSDVYREYSAVAFNSLKTDRSIFRNILLKYSSNCKYLKSSIGLYNLNMDYKSIETTIACIKSCNDANNISEIVELIKYAFSEWRDDEIIPYLSDEAQAFYRTFVSQVRTFEDLFKEATEIVKNYAL